MPASVAIVQSNYIPWKGYFDMMAKVDAFVLFDEVQYTRRDWRNRNRIKTPQGLKWLTIPVEVKGKYLQKISETRISEPSWAEKHHATLRQFYRNAPHFAAYETKLQSWYESAAGFTHLSQVNRYFLEQLMAELALPTALLNAADYPLEEGKNERLISVCKALGASHYLTGEAARGYLSEEQFAQQGISVAWMSYVGYPEYEQLYPPFEHGVTVLDLLFHTGPAARSYLLHTAASS